MTFIHSLGARGNEYFRIEINDNDNERGRELQARYDRGDEIQARATTAKERARGRAMMKRAVIAARKIAN